jgi:flagellar protein FlaF
VADGGLTDRHEIAEAIRYNRKLWTVLATSATHATNPLPDPIKNNVASLGVFILDHSLKLEIQPERERFGVLININRQIAAGLRETPAAAAATPAPTA